MLVCEFEWRYICMFVCMYECTHVLVCVFVCMPASEFIQLIDKVEKHVVSRVKVDEEMSVHWLKILSVKLA